MITFNNRNNRSNAISKKIMRMQISKSNIRILQMRLQILQITTSASPCTPLDVSAMALAN
jgi:hypothetical protein